jgi:hypothetical protein
MALKQVDFTLKEMFVVYTIHKKVELLSYRIGLKKLIGKFTEVTKFCRLIEVEDLMNKNNNQVNEKYKQESLEYRRLLTPFQGKQVKDVPVDIITNYNQLGEKIRVEQSELNKNLIEEFKKLTDDKKIHKIGVHELAQKGISSLVLDESIKTSSLGLAEEGIETLIEVYNKLEG